MGDLNKDMATTMELWNSVCTTSPSDTTRVNQRGGFTAISAQSQIKAATEKWGPYGGSWGLRDLHWGEIRDADGELIEVTLDANFESPVGKFPISSDAKWSPGQDTRKKLQTDATTKALSKLGFNADVFLGLHDNETYVAALTNEESRQSIAPSTLAAIKLLEECEDYKKFLIVWKALDKSVRDTLTKCKPEKINEWKERFKSDADQSDG